MHPGITYTIRRVFPRVEKPDAPRVALNVSTSITSTCRNAKNDRRSTGATVKSPHPHTLLKTRAFQKTCFQKITPGPSRGIMWNTSVSRVCQITAKQYNRRHRRCFRRSAREQPPSGPARRMRSCSMISPVPTRQDQCGRNGRQWPSPACCRPSLAKVLSSHGKSGAVRLEPVREIMTVACHRDR